MNFIIKSLPIVALFAAFASGCVGVNVPVGEPPAPIIPASPTAAGAHVVSLKPQETTPARTATPVVTSTAEPVKQDPQPLGVSQSACEVNGMQKYVSPGGHFCLAYPASFEGKGPVEGQLGEYILGPALDNSAEPVRAQLAIELLPLAEGADLDKAVDEFLLAFPRVEIARSEATLGGEPAVRLDNVPGYTGSRDLLAIHGGKLYHLVFMPDLTSFPQAKKDVEALYASVTQSFTFLP